MPPSSDNTFSLSTRILSINGLINSKLVVVSLAIAFFLFLLKGINLLGTLRNFLFGPPNPVPSLSGPKYKWPFGNLEDKFLRSRQKGKEWHAHHGDVYRIWSGDQAEVVLTNWKDAAIFYRDAHLHIKPRDSDGGWLFLGILGFGLGLVSEDQWRRLRGHFDPHFTYASVARFVPNVIEMANTFVDSIMPAKEKSSEFHVGDDFKKFGFFLVANFMFGDLDDKQKATLNRLIDSHTDIFKLIFGDITSMIPAAQHVPFLRSTRTLKAFHDDWLDFNQDAYEKVKGDDTYPISHLWQAYQNGGISKKELLNTVDESLFANVDVSASIVAWSILYTCAHPAHQQRLRAEIAKNASDIDGYVRRTDTYLHHTLLETLRHRPVTPLIPPESATVDKVLENGFVIPAGVKVVTDVVAVNVRDEYWGPDREVFRPSRFGELQGEDVKKHLFMFGFGPRQCLGKYIADKMVKTLLVFLFSQFSGDVIPGGKDDQDEWKVKVDTFVQLPDVQIKLTRLEKPLH